VGKRVLKTINLPGVGTIASKKKEPNVRPKKGTKRKKDNTPEDRDHEGWGKKVVLSGRGCCGRRLGPTETAKEA